MQLREARPNDEATILDFAAVLLRRWKILLAIAATVVGLTATYALLVPRTYTARATLVPSSSFQGESRAQLLAAQLPMLGLGRLGRDGSPSQGLVLAILGSTSLRDSVVNRLEETPEGRAAGSAYVREILRKRMRFESDPADRSIRVFVSTRDPELAARIVGQIPEAVNSIARHLAVEAAERRSEALDQQLEPAARRLAATEERIRAFNEEHGTSEISEQAKQSIIAAGELRRMIAEVEVRIAGLGRTTTPDHPQYRAAVAERDALRHQLRQLGRTGAEDPLLSRSQIPEIQVQLTRLLRDYSRDEQVYVSLMAELVSAQADAAGDLTVVSVLDLAQVPDEPSAPRVTLLLVLGALLGGVLAVFGAFTSDYLHRARQVRPDDEFFVEWDKLRSHLVRVRESRGTGGASVG